MTETIAAIARI